MKKSLQYIIFVVAICSSLVIMLFAFNGTSGKGGFTRKVLPLQAHILKVTVLPNNNFAFCGHSQKGIVLLNYRDKNNLFILEENSKQLDTLPLNYDENFRTVINVYHDYNNGIAYSSNPLGELSMKDISGCRSYRISGNRFDKLKGISANGIVTRVRYQNGNITNRSLLKLDLSKKEPVVNNYILSDIRNAVFANDGTLEYDAATGSILYLYYYRGEFLCLDTNLNLKYLANTIDTVSTANITTDTTVIKARNGDTLKKLIQTTPPQFVHTDLCVSENKVYVLSRLKADNEKESEYRRHQVIDVYRLSNGKYLFSFYLPKYNGSKLRKFNVKGDQLYALYGASLVQFQLGKMQLISEVPLR